MSGAADPPGAIELASIEDTSLLAFYRDMNLPERRTFWACAAGWALDGMDFMIYPLVIGTIIALWKVGPGEAGLAARCRTRHRLPMPSRSLRLLPMPCSSSPPSHSPKRAAACCMRTASENEASR